jgi:hypothetical protein
MVRTLNRRQFLTGAGGACLAVPFLPSLFEGKADASTTRPKNFIALANSHNACWFGDMFPAAATLTENTNYAGRTIRRGDLIGTSNAGRTTLSKVLSAASSALSPTLLKKLNVIAGLDMINSGHHVGGHLGNYWANDGNVGQPTAPYSIPTIDQILAYSPSFYSNLGSILRRTIEFGDPRPISYNYSNPMTRSGDIVGMAPSDDTQKAFNSVFVPPPAPGAGPARTSVVDRVFDNFQRLMKSNRRISSSDRQRLDDHVARINEIQRRLSVRATCNGLPTPTQNAKTAWIYPGPNGSNAKDAFRLINDVIVAGILCGTCRIATIGATGQGSELFSNYVGDWHQSIVHVSSTGDPTAADTLAARNELAICYQGMFEFAFLDLVNKLNVANGYGGTLLDDTLLVWTQEAGHITHGGWSVPVITAGSAGGAIKTGSYIDYRNMELQINVQGAPAVKGGYNPGLIWAQWLGTVLQAMGLPRSEYEIAAYQPERPTGVGTGGYGWWRYNPADYATQKPDHYQPAYAAMGDFLPYLKP